MENEMNSNKNSNSTLVWIIIGILVVAAIVITVIITNNSKRPSGLINEVEDTKISDPIFIDDEGSSTERETNEAYTLFAGTSLIKNGLVINNNGELVDNAARPGRENAPKITGIIDHEELPNEFRQLFISKEEGFSPEKFKVASGQVVALALISKDDLTHSIVFDDLSLSAIVLNVGPGQARAIVFNAPSEAGEYVFRSAVPRRDNQGVMIVE
jgi:hypothetical protein